MSEKVFGKVRLVGCSDQSLEKAVEAAVAGAASHGKPYWFEVVELRGAVSEGKVAEWQATVDIAFKGS